MIQEYSTRAYCDELIACCPVCQKRELRNIEAGTLECASCQSTVPTATFIAITDERLRRRRAQLGVPPG